MTKQAPPAPAGYYPNQPSHPQSQQPYPQPYIQPEPYAQSQPYTQAQPQTYASSPEPAPLPVPALPMPQDNPHPSTNAQAQPYQLATNAQAQPYQQPSYPQPQPYPQAHYMQQYPQQPPYLQPQPNQPVKPAPVIGGPRWLAAVAGVLLAFLGLSVFAAVIVGFIIAVIPINVPFDAYTDVANLLFQVLVAGLGFLWYRRLATRTASSPVVFKGVPTFLNATNPRASLRQKGRGKELVLTIVALVSLGFVLQFAISALLTLIQFISPDTMAGYNERMEQLVSNTPLRFISLVFLAPLSEEITFRGVALEYGRRVSPRAIVGLIAQAVVFGIAHLDIIQGSYAALLGLVFGLIALHVGDLPSSICLHMSLNFASYFVGLMLYPFMQLDIPGLILAIILGTSLTAFLLRYLLTGTALPLLHRPR